MGVQGKPGSGNGMATMDLKKREEMPVTIRMGMGTEVVIGLAPNHISDRPYFLFAREQPSNPSPAIHDTRQSHT